MSSLQRCHQFLGAVNSEMIFDHRQKRHLLNFTLCLMFRCGEWCLHFVGAHIRSSPRVKTQIILPQSKVQLFLLFLVAFHGFCYRAKLRQNYIRPISFSCDYMMLTCVVRNDKQYWISGIWKVNLNMDYFHATVFRRWTETNEQAKVNAQNLRITSNCTLWATKRNQRSFVCNFVKYKWILLKLSLLNFKMNDTCEVWTSPSLPN